MSELRSILSSHSLAVDYQRKVVKHTFGGDVVGQGAQTFTICGDFGLVLGVYVLPDTALLWAKIVIAEVIDRHKAAGVLWWNTRLHPEGGRYKCGVIVAIYLSGKA